MTADTRPPEAWLYFALAVVGGYGDAASVVLAKTFTGHVTGSLVLAAIAIAAHGALSWRISRPFCSSWSELSQAC